MSNSKELVRSLFAGKPVSRPPFIPLMATAVAQFMQVPVQQVFSDPTTLANSLQTCQRLFGYDGIVILFDSTLEAEACGCRLSWQDWQPPRVTSSVLSNEDELDRLDVSEIEGKGRIPAVLEAAKRLMGTAGREVAVLGVITGPVTLGRHLMGEAFVTATDTSSQTLQKLTEFWGKIALVLARAYGELKLDAVIIADVDMALLNTSHYTMLQPALKTLRNLLNFYDAPLIMHTGRVPAEGLTAFSQLEADGFAPANPLPEIMSAFPGGSLLGGAIPASKLLGTVEDIEKAALELLGSGDRSRLFVTTDGEVPLTTPPSNLHKVMQLLRTAALNK